MQGMPLNAAESSPTASQPRDAKDLETKVSNPGLQ